MKTRKTISITHTRPGASVRVSKSLEPREAAERAAGILARREFGRRGECAVIYRECVAADGSFETYRASIGVGSWKNGYDIVEARLYVPRAD